MTKPIVRKLRCAIYTRKSSEEGLEQEFNSLHAQREACEAYIASQRSEGWVQVRDQYDDGGVSGGTLERPGLQQLMADIEDGLVDVVVVYKIDRLSRSLADFAKLVEIFDRNDVTFVSVTQSFNTTTSMGRLHRAMQEIEWANPDTLFRVFGTADWGNKEKFSDELLKDLIEGFSDIRLGNNAVSTDVLGDAYEYLIGKFADVTRRNKAGEFYTPRSVVRMMVEILDPQEGESIYDPACGTGGMLLGAIEHVMRKGGDPRTFYGKIYGQEKNLTTSAIARMNLVLHGIEDFQIAREDTLRSPAFTDSSTGGTATFDCVIANPPFSLKEWGRELWEADPWGRAKYGIPPESYGDYAFVQHMIASMAQTGNSRMAVVLPQGALFRKSAEGNIRQALLENDMIEAVIGLAPNLFYGTQLAGCVVVLRRKKPPERKNKVLIIDASSLFRKGRAQNFLDHDHSDEIVSWYRAFEDVEDRAKVATIDEIKNEGWTLNISRYVLPPIGEDIPPLPEAVDAFKTALADARAAEDHLRKVLTEGGWLQ